jgi:hypothetical protein
MIQDKVTRKELAAMRIGENRIFNLPDGGKVKSAIVTCQQMRDEKGMEFKPKPDYKSNAICITRIK